MLLLKLKCRLESAGIVLFAGGKEAGNIVLLKGYGYASDVQKKLPQRASRRLKVLMRLRIRKRFTPGLQFGNAWLTYKKPVRGTSQFSQLPDCISGIRMRFAESVHNRPRFDESSQT
jgi:hypothetical protein